MRWIKLTGAVVLLLALIAGGSFLGRHELARFQEDLPAFTHRAGNEFSEMVPMADDVRLYTTVQLPSGEGPFPSVLVRNPYAQFGTIMRDTLCGRFVRYGYGCVFQDARGQGESEGDWEPGINEINDGRDTLRWLVQQDFQDGNLAMVGPSYLAAVQWAAAASGLPPEVKTIVPSVYATDNHSVMYQDGMFRHETFTAWASMMRTSNTSSDSAGNDYQRAVRHRPHREVDTKIFGVPMPWYQDMINGASRADAFWQLPENLQMLEVPKRMTIPVLMIGGCDSRPEQVCHRSLDPYW
jgi:putative CocE/NonD family hydrolase